MLFFLLALILLFLHSNLFFITFLMIKVQAAEFLDQFFTLLVYHKTHLRASLLQTDVNIFQATHLEKSFNSVL